MDKGDDSSLRNLNKLSHKISKPTIRRPDHAPLQIDAPPPPPPQHQPPVYNINRNDFREVVQKLTGSPAYDRTPALPSPPPPPPPKPTQNSRLQRIRPPPLAQISPNPPPMLSSSEESAPPANNSWFRHPPMSPLPPFPSVHAAAESPISAYMRFLHSSSAPSPLAFGCIPSPLFSPSGLSGFPQFPASPTPVPSPGKRTN